MAKVVGNRNLTNLQDSNSDLDNLTMGSTIGSTQNIDVLPQIYEPRYAPQPYNPHEGFYSNMNNQTQFAPDFSFQPNNRGYNMGNVSGEVGEYSQKPGVGIGATSVAQKSGFSWPNFGNFPSPMNLLKRAVEPNTAEENFGLGYFNRDPQTGRTYGNQAHDVFAGKNVASAFGVGMGASAQKRIDRINQTIAGWEETAAGDDLEAAERAKERLKNSQLINRRNKFQEQLDIYNQKLKAGTGGVDDTTTTDTTTQGGNTSYTPPQHHGDVSQGGGYQAPTIRSAPQGVTTSSGMHGGKHYAQGGRIGYNRGRVVNPGGYQGDEFEDENIFEFMQDQGVPHSEMAEKSPFEMRIDELMDEGMSWQEAYDIASDEFNQLAEGESDQGIASIV